MKKHASLFALAFLVFAAAALPRVSSARANSAPTYWWGANAPGLIAQSGCPIGVASEKLTFYLDEFPDVAAELDGGQSDYGGRVTAEYTFVNPTDGDITAQLAFPFGRLASYAAEIFPKADDARYGVTVNGRRADAVVRHSYSDSAYSAFDFASDAAKLYDDYLETWAYRPTTPVLRRTVRFSSLSSPLLTAKLVFPGETGTLCNETSGWTRTDRSSYPYSESAVLEGEVAEGATLVYDLIGASAAVPEISYTADGQAATATAVVTEERETLLDLVLRFRPEGSAVSDVDWYNAAVQRIASSQVLTDYSLCPVDALMPWYIYSITVPANGTAVNAVTAPIYPTVRQNSKPRIYEYTYLLSPARNWRSFGSLEIEVRTPNYLLSSSFGAEDEKPKFEKTEFGYRLTVDGLPSGELEFSLSSSEKPKIPVSAFDVFGGIVAGGIVCFFVAGAIVLIVFAARSGKKKNGNPGGSVPPSPPASPSSSSSSPIDTGDPAGEKPTDGNN